MLVYLILILGLRSLCAFCQEVDGGDETIYQESNSSRLIFGKGVMYTKIANDLNSWCTVSIRTLSYIRYWGDNHYCGGAIITSRWVLTAAYCVTVASKNSVYRVVERNRISVVLGNMYRLARPDHRNIIHVSKIWVHSRYVRTCNHDIALIKLNRPIWSSRTYPKRMRLPKQPLGLNIKCYTLGWGRVYRNGPYADELMVLNVHAVPFQICMDTFRSSRKCPFNLCLSSIDQHGALCHGDTGSPLYCDGVLYGLAVGIRKRCLEGSVMLYSNLYDHVNWIQYVMANSAGFQLCSKLALFLLLILRVN